MSSSPASGKHSRKLYDLPEILREPADLPKDLPRVRHEFEGIWPHEDGWLIRGWAAAQNAAWTKAILFLNGNRIGEALPWDREDLKAHSGHLPNITGAGFRFVVDKSLIDPDTTHRADVVLCKQNDPIASIWSLLRTDIAEIVPHPPEHLMKRVIGTDDASYFLRFALTCFGQYTAAVTRHREMSTIKSMLDWGCGCGRVTAHYLRIVNGPAVTGCDIDPEDIDWCKDNLVDGRFDATSPFVPLPYGNGEFDLVVSLSVMTHLTKDQQEKWLAEIDRVLAPGGLFVCSVHGVFGAQALPDSFMVERLKKQDIVDGQLDHVLDGIAPAGYYRATYETGTYTRKSFGKHFDVLELGEGGVGVQDLVVARKREAKKGLLGQLRR